MNSTRLAVMFIMVATIILSTSTVSNAAVLRNGSAGADVKVLQTELRDLGYPVGSIDGMFGKNTTAAVKQFQANASLEVDGIVGDKTIAALTIKLRQKTTNDIVTEAKKYIGVSYRWGGTTTAGFDCSGFTQYVFKSQGITLPRVSQDQAKTGTSVAFADLQPGDLVFFAINTTGTVSHVGIYLGGGQFINASTSKGVTIYTLGAYWKSVYAGARRVY